MDNNNKFCGVSNVKSALPSSPQNAMAYVPFQLDSREFSVEEALKNGTLFPVLNKPFTGGGKNG